MVHIYKILQFYLPLQLSIYYNYIVHEISTNVGMEERGLLTIAEKCKSYIATRKHPEKDPSESLPAPDGSGDDCISNL